MKNNYRTYYTILLIFICQLLNAKNKPLTIKLIPVWNQQLLNIDSIYTNSEYDFYKITQLKFYISSIELLNNNSTVWKEKKSFHLIDFENNTSTKINLSIKKNINFNQIKFNIGIDSLTNISGAFGGHLDPTNGMYWTWQNGYINLKLEGNYTTKNEAQKDFQLHIGGYSGEFNSMAQVILNIPKQYTLNLNLDIQKVVSYIQLNKYHHIMSPCLEAKTILQYFASCIILSN